MKLFLSCTALIHQLFDGRVTEEDLDSGIFYLGCAREGVRPQMEQSLGYSIDIDGGRAARPFDYDSEDYHQAMAKGRKEATYAANRVREVLPAALARTELEGRLVWRPHPGSNSYKQLNGLLFANGLNPIEIKERRQFIRDDYNYPAVIKRMEVANPEVPTTWS